MPDVNELVETLKKAAIEAVEAKKPVSIYFGEVVSDNPLKINVEQKMVLSDKQLILTGTILEKGLVVDENVILVRMQGGQKFIVMDTLT